MRRSARTRWAGAWLLGTALGAAGCMVSVNHPAPDGGTPFTIHPAPAPAPDAAGARTAARPPALPPDTHGAAITTITPVPAALATAPPGARYPANAGATYGAPKGSTLVVTAAGPASARSVHALPGRPVLQLDASGGDGPDAAGGVRQVSARLTLPADTLHGPDLPTRRGYVDLTAQPWFGCADDHSWLNGQVMYSRTTGTWRLHYASVDDSDPYGGTVTLLTSDELKGLKDGEYVRVSGCPVDPDLRVAGAPYRVTSYEVVERPH